MTLNINTLRLCRLVLGNQTISANADRAEIVAILDARDEIDAAINEAEASDDPRP